MVAARVLKSRFIEASVFLVSSRPSMTRDFSSGLLTGVEGRGESWVLGIDGDAADGFPDWLKVKPFRGTRAGLAVLRLGVFVCEGFVSNQNFKYSRRCLLTEELEKSFRGFFDVVFPPISCLLGVKLPSS